jgi:hypothetical protein
MKKKPIRIFKKNRFDFRNLKSKNQTEPKRIHQKVQKNPKKQYNFYFLI